MRGRDKMYYIYRYIEQNRVIYVGKTKRDLRERIEEHKSDRKFMSHLAASKIEYFTVPTQVEMDIAEKYYINKYRPMLNIVDMDNATFPYQLDYRWNDYTTYVPEKTSKIQSSSVSYEQEQLEIMEQMLVLYDNLEEFLDYIWNAYIDETLDIDGNLVFYKWDFDRKPLPDNIQIQDVCIGFYISAQYEERWDTYYCFNSLKNMDLLIHHGKEACKKERMALREKMFELEEKIERVRN